MASVQERVIDIVAEQFQLKDKALGTLELNAITEDRTADVLAVDRALGRLAEHDERLARIVEMRFFAGMTDVEIAQVLGVTDRTVRNQWSFARVWLRRELEGH